MFDTSRYGFSNAALKFTERLSKVDRRRIIQRIEKLIEDPFPVGSKKIRDITDWPDPVYRIRVGNYRVLYAVSDDPQIIILDIDHRKDVYRRNRRRR